MKRTSKGLNVRKDFVYDTDKVLELYGITANTLSNWKAQGLRSVEGTRPNLFRGAELISFRKAVKKRGKVQRRLRAGEFKCLPCDAAVLPAEGTLTVARSYNQKWIGTALCTECGRPIKKILAETECDDLLNGRAPKICPDSSDEGNDRFEGDIGISEAAEIKWNPANERIIHEWLLYSGRYDDKTVIAHLADIRRFEGAMDLKDFRETAPEDAAGYRNMLIAGARGVGRGARPQCLNGAPCRVISEVFL